MNYETGEPASTPANVPYREKYACKVCGNVPDEDGTLEHGKGCYTQDVDGGGVSFVEFEEVSTPEVYAKYPPVDFAPLPVPFDWMRVEVSGEYRAISDSVGNHFRGVTLGKQLTEESLGRILYDLEIIIDHCGVGGWRLESIANAAKRIEFELSGEEPPEVELK